MLLARETFRRLCHARDLLAETNDETSSIKSIAAQVRISHFHFIRQFEAVFGLTPHQFRIRYRLDRAKLLLARGHHSVTDVCMEVGFSSLGSFSHLFARRFGAPPSLYQRRARSLVHIPGVLPQEFFPGCLTLMRFLPSTAFRNFQEASSQLLP